MCIVVKNTMCNLEVSQITIRLYSDEIAQIDREWRGNFEYKNRTEYIREKLGFNRRVEKL